MINFFKEIGSGWIVMLYFALKPLYIWESGGLQPCDIILMLYLLYTFVKKGLNFKMIRKDSKVLSVFSLVVLFQIFVNFTWNIILDAPEMIRFSLYYIFNLFAFFLCIVIGHEIGLEKIKKSLAYGALFSSLVCIIGLHFFPSELGRDMAFFNNPNQLGYHSLILLTVALFCKDTMSKHVFVLLCIASLWGITVSLSKAAILGAFILSFLYILFYQKEKNIKIVLMQLILILFLIYIIYFLFYSESEFVLYNDTLTRVRYRILYMMDESDTNLDSGRGYGRIFEMGFNFLWGMGEGAFNRFSSRTGAELHSTFVSLYVCYGLVGLLSYIYIIYKCVNNKYYIIQNLSLLSGVLSYSLTHNGVRNTLFWFLLATLLISKQSFVKKRGANNEYKEIS